jgi:hypothetical protein
MTRRVKILLLAAVWTIAVGLCVLVSAFPKLASATTHEAYGAACTMAGFVTADLLRRRRD